MNDDRFDYYPEDIQDDDIAFYEYDYSDEDYEYTLQ